MPELPEVETVRKVLLPIVKGRTIKSIEVLREKTIISGAKEFQKALENQTFLDVTRIGKFLIFHLTNDLVFISHLRMEGKYFEYNEGEEHRKYARVIFHLDNNKKLVYDDSRCFGIIKLTSEKDYRNDKEIAQLGPEPFQIKDADYFIDRCKKSTHPIKSTLLDQTLMTGLGNIYADEVLFASKINPFIKAKDITKKQWEDIVRNAVRILNEAIEMGGSTIKSYHPGKDIDGNFQTVIKAYGKRYEDCPNCGSKFHFTTIGGRGSTYCPFCQPLKQDKLIVAITGKIASGKSTVLANLKDKGYPILSCDTIVHDLYMNSDFQRKLIEKLDIKFEAGFNINELRLMVAKDKKLKKKLEQFVHPFVYDIIAQEYSRFDKGVFFVEVPLLYESHGEDRFDFVIALDINEKEQMERLKKRNLSSSSLLKVINMNNKFDSYKSKVDFIINNDSTPDKLNGQINLILNKLKLLLN